ncbi:MAG: hypothetical protein WBW94_08655 [Anaerolineales bacterium]
MDIKFNKEFEEKLAGFFAIAFKEVVLPVLKDMDERLASKEDLNSIKEDMVDVKNRLGKVDDKLTKIEDRLDRLGKTQENLEKRVVHLEEAANFSN